MEPGGVARQPGGVDHRGGLAHGPSVLPASQVWPSAPIARRGCPLGRGRSERSGKAAPSGPRGRDSDLP